MKDLEQVKEALDSAIAYLRNQDLGEIGRQTQGKLLEAEPLVKNLIIHSVSNQRELLTDFLIWYKNSVPASSQKNSEQLAEEYINL